MSFTHVFIFDLICIYELVVDISFTFEKNDTGKMIVESKKLKKQEEELSMRSRRQR